MPEEKGSASRYEFSIVGIVNVHANSQNI